MKQSAGILLYRWREGSLELLLAHPGGPFWARKDLGSWSIPKGEYREREAPLACARREFQEELGSAPPAGEYLDLGEVDQRGHKAVKAWAAEGDFDPSKLVSNPFEMEWPPKSGRRASFPEVDRAAWFSPDVARVKILQAQRVFVDRLLALLEGRST